MHLLEIRIATQADYCDLADIMFDAVRNGPSAYSQQQQAAWVPERRSGPEWEARLGTQTVFVAFVDERAVGFMSLEPTGYLDFAYVRPANQGQGVFRKLYEAIEAQAFENGLRRINTHASIMARPAFSAVGFAVIQKEVVQIRNESFERFEMQKCVALD